MKSIYEITEKGNQRRDKNNYLHSCLETGNWQSGEEEGNGGRRKETKRRREGRVCEGARCGHAHGQNKVRKINPITGQEGS